MDALIAQLRTGSPAYWSAVVGNELRGVTRKLAYPGQIRGLVGVGGEVEGLGRAGLLVDDPLELRVPHRDLRLELGEERYWGDLPVVQERSDVPSLRPARRREAEQPEHGRHDVDEPDGCLDALACRDESRSPHDQRHAQQVVVE